MGMNYDTLVFPNPLSFIITFVDKYSDQMSVLIYLVIRTGHIPCLRSLYCKRITVGI